MLLLCGTLTLFATARADARADITNYFTGFGWRAPSSFEPGGHDRIGTASEIIVNRTANWTIFSNMGNVGIGNGSTAAFGDVRNLSDLPSNYSDNYFMAGDVSQQPLDPVRELNLNVAAPAAAENNTTAAGAGNATAENNTAPGPGNAKAENNSTPLAGGNASVSSNASLPKALSGADIVRSLNASRQGRLNNTSLEWFNETILAPLSLAALPSANNTSRPAVNNTPGPGANNTSEEAANNTTGENETATRPSGMTPENATMMTYHPISIGRPINDLLYEHPLAASISCYCRLVGLATPSGVPVNVGMRCLGYGY